MFDPEGYADLARELVGDVDYEAEARSRSAVSRAYYSLFLAIRSAVLTAHGLEVHGRELRLNHGTFKDSLFHHSDELDGLGMVLEELMQARRTADYVLEPSGGAGRYTKPGRAKKLVKKVQGVLRQLDGIDFTPVPPPT